MYSFWFTTHQHNDINDPSMTINDTSMNYTRSLDLAAQETEAYLIVLIN